MEPFDGYLYRLRTRGKPAKTIDQAEKVLGMWTGFLGDRGLAPADATAEDVEDFLLGTGWSPYTMRQGGLVYIRAAYRHGQKRRVVMHNPCMFLDLPAVQRSPRRTVAPAVAREVKANLRTARDALVFAIFAYTGCRGCEVRRLTWNDVSLAAGTMEVEGKGGHRRIVPIHPELRDHLEPLAGASPYVLPGRNGRQLAPSGLDYATGRVWGRWGVTAHDWRRTVATNLRRNGVDSTVRDVLMGWGPKGMFGTFYNDVTVQDLQAAMRKLYVDDPI